MIQVSAMELFDANDMFSRKVAVDSRGFVEMKIRLSRAQPFGVGVGIGHRMLLGRLFFEVVLEVDFTRGVWVVSIWCSYVNIL